MSNKLIFQAVFIVACAFIVGIYTGSAFLLMNRKLKEVYHGKPGCLPLPHPKNVTLHYFSVRGKAECIRLIMEEGSISYSDKAFTKTTWPAAKLDGIKTNLYPFGQVPAIETGNGRKLAQSLVISQHIARSVGLDCDCEDYDYCNLLIQGTEDIKQNYGRLLKDESYDFASRINYLETVLPMWLNYFEKLAPSLVKQNKAFFSSDRLTYVDLIIFEMLETQINYANYDFNGQTKKINVLEDLPKLKHFFNLISKRKRISEYLNSPKRYKFSMFRMPKEVK